MIYSFVAGKSLTLCVYRRYNKRFQGISVRRGSLLEVRTRVLGLDTIREAICLPIEGTFQLDPGGAIMRHEENPNQQPKPHQSFRGKHFPPIIVAAGGC
jgi:hypothetical protein